MIPYPLGVFFNQTLTKKQTVCQRLINQKTDTVSAKKTETQSRILPE